MARKRTKGKAVKRVARKKTTQAARSGRTTAKAAKKPHTVAPKAPLPKPAVPATVESPGSIDLLRSWSPSRYSGR